jgi:ankyrin repeat protein
MKIDPNDWFVLARSGDVEAMKKVLSKSPDLLDSWDMMGATALHIAARHGNLHMATALLCAGANANAAPMPVLRVLRQRTPLCNAASSGQQGVAKLLIEHEADINGKPGIDLPLVCAVGADDLAMVRLLVESGADINLPYQPQGGPATALDLAEERGNHAIAGYLRSRGARSLRRPTAPCEDLLTSHIARTLGHPNRQSLTVVTSGVQILVVPPQNDSGFVTLVTNGIHWLQPLETEHVEAFIQLPAQWPCDPERSLQDGNDWPFRWLIQITGKVGDKTAELREGSLVEFVHGKDQAPSPFPAAIFAAGTNTIPEFRGEDDEPVRFLRVVPVYSEECLLLRQVGAQRLLAALAEAQADGVVLVGRPPVRA